LPMAGVLSGVFATVLVWSVRRTAPLAPARLEQRLSEASAELRRKVRSRAVSSSPRRLQRFEVEVCRSEAPPEVPLRWLRAQGNATKVYWACPLSRSGDAIAGLGAAEVVSGRLGAEDSEAFDRALSLPEGARFLGGGRFDASTPPGKEWDVFRGHAFVLPELTLERFADGRLVMARHVMARHVGGARGGKESDGGEGVLIRDVVPQLCRRWESSVDDDDDDDTDYDSSSESYSVSSTVPSAEEWCALVSQFRQRDDLEKVVLARRRRFRRRVEQDNDDPWSLLAKLEAQPGAVDFCYRFGLELAGSDAVFVGSSPELLCDVRGRSLKCDVLAGTRKRDLADPSADAALAEDLLRSAKDKVENDIVRAFVEDRLRDVSATLAFSSVAVVKLANVQHLRREVTATLRPSISNAAVLRSLHPTPATLGTPPEKARAFLREGEGFDRGWFAGPFGAVSAEDATFAVALRSALTLPSETFAYAGAGIVAGSDATKEADEVDFKLKPIDDALAARGKKNKPFAFEGGKKARRGVIIIIIIIIRGPPRTYTLPLAPPLFDDEVMMNCTYRVSN